MKPAAKRYIGHAEQAKLLRAQLKKNFPAVKFSVRSHSYAGGASIDVKWTDGPTLARVKEIADPFAGGGFDGSIDLAYNKDSWLCPDGSVAFGRSDGTQGSRGYHAGFDNPPPCEGAELVSFAANYVSCDRSISPALANLCIAQLVDFWRGEIPAVPVAVPSSFGFSLAVEDPATGLLINDGQIGNKPIRPDLGGNGATHYYTWGAQIRAVAEDRTKYNRAIADAEHAAFMAQRAAAAAAPALEADVAEEHPELTARAAPLPAFSPVPTPAAAARLRLMQ